MHSTQLYQHSSLMMHFTLNTGSERAEGSRFVEHRPKQMPVTCPSRSLSWVQLHQSLKIPSGGLKGLGDPCCTRSTQTSPSASTGSLGSPSSPPQAMPYTIPQSTGHTCHGGAEPGLYASQDRCNKTNLLPLSPNGIIET